MLRHKDSQQLGKLYQHILTEKKIKSNKLDESFLDKLATADPNKILKDYLLANSDLKDSDVTITDAKVIASSNDLSWETDVTAIPTDR